MKHIASIVAAVLVLAIAQTSYAQEGLDGLRLADFSMGSHVAGPQVSGKDIKGKVVVIEYWGITCGPCIASIPHTTELATKYGHDKLIIFANQSWSASDRQTQEVWQKHAKSDDVVVVNGGNLEGFRPTGVPHAVIFDHEGNAVWRGHPGGMDRPLADAIAKMPEQPAEEAAEEQSNTAPIVTGIEPKFFEREINDINLREGRIDAALSKVRRAAEHATQQEQIEEAKAVLDAVESWAGKQTVEIKQALASDPARAYAITEANIELLGRDELADGFNELKKQMEADDALMDTIRSTIMLREIMAEATAIGLTEDPAAAQDASNAREARKIARDLRRIVKVWPETEAGKKAVELLTAWGLDE